MDLAWGQRAGPPAATSGLLPQLRRARDHLDRYYDQPLCLDQLAQVAALSKYHFARGFETAYGETPMRYLARRRIERAQDLLRAANLTVTEVCMLVGFTSLGSFSSRFTQLEKGEMGGLGLRVDNCRQTYEELSGKGVTFLQEPAGRPYGVEAVMRDVSGNWLVLVEPKEFTPADFR